MAEAAAAGAQALAAAAQVIVVQFTSDSPTFSLNKMFRATVNPKQSTPDHIKDTFRKALELTGGYKTPLIFTNKHLELDYKCSGVDVSVSTQEDIDLALEMNITRFRLTLVKSIDVDGVHAATRSLAPVAPSAGAGAASPPAKKSKPNKASAAATLSQRPGRGDGKPTTLFQQMHGGSDDVKAAFKALAHSNEHVHSRIGIAVPAELSNAGGDASFDVSGGSGHVAVTAATGEATSAAEAGTAAQPSEDAAGQAASAAQLGSAAATAEPLNVADQPASEVTYFKAYNSPLPERDAMSSTAVRGKIIPRTANKDVEGIFFLDYHDADVDELDWQTDIKFAIEQAQRDKVGPSDKHGIIVALPPHQNSVFDMANLKSRIIHLLVATKGTLASKNTEATADAEASADTLASADSLPCQTHTPMVFVCSADTVDQLRRAAEDKVEVLLEITPKPERPAANTQSSTAATAAFKSTKDMRFVKIMTPAEHRKAHPKHPLQGQALVDYESKNALMVFEHCGMVPMDAEFHKMYCTKCEKIMLCRKGARLFRSQWKDHVCKKLKNPTDFPSAYALAYADKFVVAAEANDSEMDTSSDSQADGGAAHATAEDATGGQTEAVADAVSNADAEAEDLPPPPLPNARSYEMLEYIWTHKEKLNLTIPLFVCEELVNAAAVEVLHPNYVNQRRHLSTVAALSDLMHASNSSHMNVCRSHLPLQKRTNVARRSAAPVCVSGAVVDLLLAFYQGGIATGPGLFSDGSRRSHLVLGGKDKADLLLAIEGSDGLAIKSDICYDPYSGQFVGFVDAGIEEFKQHFRSLDVLEATINIETATEFAKEHKAASEAVVFLLCTVNGTFSCPVGIFFTPKTGGHAAVKSRHDEMRAQYARCYECLKENKRLNQDKPCEHAPNASKDDKCTRCTELGLRCVKIDLVAWSTDRASDQAAYLDVLERDVIAGNSTQVPLGDAFHIAKNAKNCATNCVIRTHAGSWSLAHVMTVLRAWSDWQTFLHLEDCCPVDRQDCGSTERIRDLIRSVCMDPLDGALIVQTLEPAPFNKAADTPFFKKKQPLSITWTPASVILTLCLYEDDVTRTICVTSCSFGRASYDVQLDPSIRSTAKQITHAGKKHALVLTSSGDVYSLVCDTAAGTIKMIGAVSKVVIACTQHCGPLTVINGDVHGRVCAADAHTVYSGQWQPGDGVLELTPRCQLEAVTSIALAYDELLNDDTMYCVAEGRVLVVEPDKEPWPLLECLGTVVARTAEPCRTVVATTDGNVFIVSDDGNLHRFRQSSLSLCPALTLRGEGAVPKDGVGIGAATTGIAASGKCIGSGGADVVWCERKSAALRHLVSGLPMKDGLTLIGNLVDVTGKPDEYIAPSRAVELFTFPKQYMDKLNEFNVLSRGRSTGNSTVGSFSDDCRKAIAMNLRSYERLAAHEHAARVNIAFTSEVLVETFFSVLTFHGNGGVTRLNQQQCGAAFIKAAQHWLNRSPASGSVVSMRLDPMVPSNRVYQRKAHALTAACDRVIFKLTSRIEKKCVLNPAYVKFLQCVRRCFGILRQARVRPATTTWHADGFAVLMSRLGEATFSVVSGDTDATAVDAVGDETEVGAASASGAATTQVLTYTQGDNLCVVPGDDDPFWLCRIASVERASSSRAAKLLVYYYELYDQAGGYYRLDTSRLHEVDPVSIVSSASVLHGTDADNEPMYYVTEETRNALGRRVAELNQVIVSQRRAERAATSDVRAAEAEYRDEMGLPPRLPRGTRAARRARNGAAAAAAAST